MNLLKSCLCFALFINFSYGFGIRANCSVENGKSAICEVCNFDRKPIVCNIETKGLTNASQEWIIGNAQVYIRPGSCVNGHAMVHDLEEDPFVFAKGQAECSF